MKLKLLTMDVRYEHDVVLARQRARTIAAALKFDVQAQTRIATAVSEVVRNAFQYAGGGSIGFEIENGAEKMLLISVRDSGRGIPNLDEILGGKYVSKTGMGLGIIGAKRLMDHFQVETEKSSGTLVVLGKNIPDRFTRLDNLELNSLLATIERKPSENPYEELQQQNKELMRTLEELRTRQIELAQLNRELDETNRGVVALYAELNDKADFLQRASELKSHFLSNMSHEFRTPLNSILALSQILLDRMDGDLTLEQEKQVTFVRRSAQDLTDLVNDLLDLAKVEAGKVTIRPSTFSVESIFAALRGMLRPLLAQNSSVSLVFDDPEGIPGSPHGRRQGVADIVGNFISNALKFTERGEVRARCAEGHDQTVVFSVADTGIGIAPGTIRIEFFRNGSRWKDAPENCQGDRAWAAALAETGTTAGRRCLRQERSGDWLDFLRCGSGQLCGRDRGGLCSRRKARSGRVQAAGAGGGGQSRSTFHL